MILVRQDDKMMNFVHSFFQLKMIDCCGKLHDLSEARHAENYVEESERKVHKMGFAMEVILMLQ